MSSTPIKTLDIPTSTKWVKKAPVKPNKPEKPSWHQKIHWENVALAIIAVISGILTGFAALCFTAKFPAAFLGGKVASAGIGLISFAALATSGVMIYKRWSHFSLTKNV